MGLDLIEWTYDPLQAMNAHLNFAKLGVVVEEYEVNVYGESSSPLHKGNPTDRFVAEWFVGDARVERAAARRRAAGARADGGARRPRPRPAGEWLRAAPRSISPSTRSASASRSRPGSREMLSAAPDLALEWRMTTRELFTTYFARGYRAVEFFLDRPSRKGTYLLVKQA